MSTFLFDEIIFGPINSRRLGTSLGINLLPSNRKICSFDCVYCECGFNKDGNKSDNTFPKREDVKTALEIRLQEMRNQEKTLNSITFSGNGEPTLHLDFAEIIEDTIELRNRYYPEAKISVLSNSTTLNKSDILDALQKIDNNIMKLDASSDDKMKAIDQPVSSRFNLNSLIADLKKFNGNLIIQTIFLRGNNDGKSVDNTSPEEVSRWIEIVKEIAPKQVMIYSLDRETPGKTLEKVSKEELELIANQVRNIGISVLVA